MWTIQEYFLGRSGQTRISLPKRSKILGVGCENGRAVLWVKVWKEEPVRTSVHRFLTLGTNEELKEPHLTYVGSVLLPPIRWTDPSGICTALSYSRTIHVFWEKP
jgi:hypothetical protein